MATNSETFENIKIPYPSEGVIRTSAIDDTLTPENSVQIGVNVNFDRIGAIQTRKGLTQYAPQLSGQIKNFGTLNNTEIPSGFQRLIKLPMSDAFDSNTATYISASKIDDTHYILFWADVGGLGQTQVVEVDLATGEITTQGSPFEFDSTAGENNKTLQLDSTHFLNIWTGTGQDGHAQIFTVDINTWAVTDEGSPFVFEAGLAEELSMSQVDSNHFLVFWTTTTIGRAQILKVDLGTFAVTAEGSPLQFSATTVIDNSCSSLNDGNHFINFWTDGPTNDGFVQVFNVNTGTWAVTAIGSPLEFDTDNGRFNSCASLGDGQHFINFWQGTDFDGFSQVFEVNLSTFAVTSLLTPIEFDTESNITNSCVSMGDGQHFVNFWRSTSNLGKGQIFEVNLTTFAVTASGIPEGFSTTSVIAYNSAVFVSSSQVINFWQKSDNSGVGSVFNLYGVPIFHDILYAQQGDADVLNLESGVWTSRRTGLRNIQKARFTQYLNRIWMVNGNALTGNPVQTSDGGNFDNTLVPDSFPPGDFIQAGFEGRVWVVDKLYDIVYFTDIVQFTPPNTYTLTYDPETNFIKNFSPQNGQTITGLITTPRALLLFKEDSIYRIYGATSVDAYPAYNVGTYSQESIIETKDGIYFHHSSGFYKFAYDSQPVEISRRIIDFIQAIPRSNYGEIKGIYDGFDAVEWAVGAVTVEGVTYTNCVLRYTISTQIWTIYDYPSNYITAFIYFDDGTNLNMIMGTDVGKVLKMDDGYTDLGQSIYFETIDRWRSFTEMYAKIKSINGINIYTENAGGVKLQYQNQDAGPNQWEDIGTITEEKNTLFSNVETDDFNVIRTRLTGNTKGVPIVFHGIELLKVDDKGFSQN